MKTLTVTFHHTTNYGATFQAYALQKKIESLGHENLLFEYPDRRKLYSKVPLSKPYLALRSIYLNANTLIRKSKHLALWDSFDTFKKKHMSLTRVYDSVDDLRNNAPDVDALISGSDQVWNMRSNPKFKDAHFLDFGKKNTIRFSYAASIEYLNYTDAQKEYVKKVLANFKGISLREKSAKEYIDSFTDDLNTEVVLDPVFLLKKEEWRKVSVAPRIKAPYILVYQVLSNDNMQKVVNELKKKTGYPIVSINNGTHKWIKADYTFFDVSPEEFLGFYDNASMVVSSSFHGTALGLVFHKPTYSLIKNISASRATDLMTKMKLEQFLISSESELPEPKTDKDVLKERLDKEISTSESFLKRMLDGN